MMDDIGLDDFGADVDEIRREHLNPLCAELCADYEPMAIAAALFEVLQQTCVLGGQPDIGKALVTVLRNHRNG